MYQGIPECSLNITDFLLSLAEPFIFLGSRRIWLLVKGAIVKCIHTKHISLATKDIAEIFRTLAFQLSIFWGVWWVNGIAKDEPKQPFALYWCQKYFFAKLWNAPSKTTENPRTLVMSYKWTLVLINTSQYV